ncbi:hypothetical protein ACFVVM_26625 [Nocardia sp. NPDC058176]|uniref:hypothetical protein n=1 Tax=Nocardia sp. NPDC058176 TaxID=3346368 RepID=UPI0036DA049C
MTTFATDTTTWHPKDGPTPHPQRLLSGPGLTLVRISFRQGQLLDEHRAPGPILITCVSGLIDLDITTPTPESHLLEPHTTIYVPAGAPHRLLAREDTVIHVTLHRTVHGE